MGEYALYRGERVKIGTCEDMYYLRYDQRHRVTWQPGNVDPVKDAAELRFRFPWPDEDKVEPGNFFPYNRAIWIPGLTAPVPLDQEHEHVQFIANAGYNVCLPCPESEAYIDRDGARLHIADTIKGSYRIHRNGFRGSVLLSAQRYRPDVGLVPILRCGGCGIIWREEDPARIEEIATLLRSAGDRRLRDGSESFWRQIADRVLMVNP